MPSPMKHGPILFFSVDHVKVAGFAICGVNSTDIGAINGGAIVGQKGQLRAVSRNLDCPQIPFC